MVEFEKDTVSELLDAPIQFIKKYICPTKIDKYNFTDYKVEDRNSFSKIFPQLYFYLSTFDEEISCILINKIYSTKDEKNNSDSIKYEDLITILNSKSNFKYLMFHTVDKFSSSFYKDTFIKTYWENMRAKNKTTTANHTILTLILCYYDFKFINLGEYDENLILWTMLFHDIAKYISLNPELKEKYEQENLYNDPCHPFKSAALTIKILYLNGFFVENTESKDSIETLVNDIYNLLINSMNFIFNNKGDRYYRHDLKNIDLIIKNLNSLRSKENDWIVDVIFLIMIHQSLDNNQVRPNDPVFSDEQICLYFTKRLFELALVVYINDSLSYTYFGVNEFTKQITEFHVLKRKSLLMK